MTPTRRVILLGASNLTRSFPVVVQTVRQIWTEPVEILVAMGHGRSYGQESLFLGRKISGIFPCALWQDLQNRPRLPTAALITDIGNDLLYGVTPDRLLDWVQRCADRLAEFGATTIITQLPVDSIDKLGQRRFQFFRRLFFPRSQLTLRDARALAREINSRLIAIGELRKIPVIPVSPSWYGFDPIHLKRGVKLDAWSALLAEWRAADRPFAATSTSLWTTAYLAGLAPFERSIFGIRRRAAQPSGRLSDGTTISIY
jgi:hypothetical protein